MLVCLPYAHRASHSMSGEILNRSQRNKPGKRLSGMLCCNADVFLQALEGPRSEVNALYNRLADDSRHKDLTILDYTEISVRRYSSWSMGRGQTGQSRAVSQVFIERPLRPIPDDGRTDQRPAAGAQ